jgi:hypothetical protein
VAKLTNQNVHASNSMLIFIRGKEVGRVNGLSISPDFGTQAVPEGIGSIMPAEHVPLEWRGEVSIESFMIRLRSTASGNTGIQDILGCPVGEDILLTETFDILVTDKVTKETVLVCEGCTWASVSFSIRQGAITGKDCRAMALRIKQNSRYNPKF